MSIEQLKGLIAGVILGMLISGATWLWRRGPSSRQLSRYLWQLGMNNEEIARITFYRNQAEFWVRDWRTYRFNPAAGRIPLPRRTRAPAIVAAALGAWLVLSSFGPAPQACREDNAAFVIRRTVSRDVPSNGTTISVPAGVAVAWSCASQDEAEQELQRQIAQIP